MESKEVAKGELKSVNPEVSKTDIITKHCISFCFQNVNPGSQL